VGASASAFISVEIRIEWPALRCLRGEPQRCHRDAAGTWADGFLYRPESVKAFVKTPLLVLHAFEVSG
jgi:hypothetical protein